jgi:hypothetical protein
VCSLASLVLAAGLAGASAAAPAAADPPPWPVDVRPRYGSSPGGQAPGQPGAGGSPAPPAALPREQVQQAVEQLRQDPELGGKRKQRSLRLKNRDQPKPAETRPLPWLVEFFRWLAETSRLLVWVLGAATVAVLLVGLRRWFRWHRGHAAARLPELPSHVRDLDIRRESLPSDVGAAARALRQRGQARGALSLLYRGALSRLVHGHAVPVRAASTEDECVRLAAATLVPAAGEFFARLVRAWQLAVYGGRLPEDAEVLALCAGFDSQLGRPDPPPIMPGRPGTAAA